MFYEIAHTLGSTVCILIHRQLSAPRRKASPSYSRRLLTTRITRALPCCHCRISIAKTHTCLQPLSLLSAHKFTFTTHFTVHAFSAITQQNISNLVSLKSYQHQNRTVARKFSNRGTLGLCGGAWHSKNWQKLNWFIVRHFQFGGGLELVWGRAKPPKVPRGDGTASEHGRRCDSILPLSKKCCKSVADKNGIVNAVYFYTETFSVIKYIFDEANCFILCNPWFTCAYCVFRCLESFRSSTTHEIIWETNSKKCADVFYASTETYGYIIWCSLIVCIRHYSLNTTIAFYSVNEWSNFAVSVW